MCVPLFYGAVDQVMEKLPDYTYSIIYVDDGSPDHTLSVIKDLAEQCGGERVKYISFSRNFGKEAAIYAGLSASTGDAAALMDADLQHPPSLLPQMLAALDEEDYDCVAARRVSRKGEPKLRSLFSRAFYALINKVSDVRFEPNVSDFRVMKREMVEAVLSLGEKERFTKGIISWVGFKNKWINYVNVERAAGETTWSFIKLVKYAISGIVAFSTAPLRLATFLGVFVVICAFLYSVYTFILVFVHGEKTSGYATIIIVLLFLGGFIITLLGIIGEYLAMLYKEIKNRPIYIAKETNIHNEAVTGRN